MNRSNKEFALNQITKFLNRFIVANYVPHKVKVAINSLGDEVKALSFGTSDGGYTLRVGEVYLEEITDRALVYDPKRPPRRILCEEKFDVTGKYVVVPAKTDFFVKILEEVNYPSSVTAEYLPKSGFPALIKCAAGDPGYSGRLTFHCYNQKTLSMKVYIDEGIVSQKLFEHDNLNEAYDPSQVSRQLRVGD